MNAPQFDHEKLHVYHASLSFVGVAPDRVYEGQGTYGPQLAAEQEQVKEQA